MQYDPASAAAHVAHAVIAVKTRLRKYWPIEITDSQALVIGLCGVLENSNTTIELACDNRLGRIVNANAKELAINHAEFALILKHLSVRGTALGGVEHSEWFCSLRTRVERALVCTLSETSVATLWTRPGVQLATVLVFQCRTPTITALDCILGSVVRSDSRRVDDLNYECLTETPDPASLCEALELVARAVV